MSLPSSPPYHPGDDSASTAGWDSSNALQKIVTLKLSSKLLQKAAQRTSTPSRSTPASSARSRSHRPGGSTPSNSTANSLAPAPASASLNPPSSPGHEHLPASPTPKPAQQGTGASSAPTPAATGTAATGGARGAANVATNAALRALDRTGTPVRHWIKTPIKLKSFTGVQYQIITWTGGPRDETTEFGALEEEPDGDADESIITTPTPSGAATPLSVPSTPTPSNIGGPSAKRNGGSLLAQSPMTPSSFSPGT